MQKKPGRPPKLAYTDATESQEVILETQTSTEELDMKIGTFITVNTINVKGIRINLDKVFSYAPNGETSIQLAQGDGNNTILNFGSKEEMLKTLEAIDNKCQ